MFFFPGTARKKRRRERKRAKTEAKKGAEAAAADLINRGSATVVSSWSEEGIL